VESRKPTFGGLVVLTWTRGYSQAKLVQSLKVAACLVDRTPEGLRLSKRATAGSAVTEEAYLSHSRSKISRTPFRCVNRYSLFAIPSDVVAIQGPYQESSVPLRLRLRESGRSKQREVQQQVQFLSLSRYAVRFFLSGGLLLNLKEITRNLPRHAVAYL